MPKKVSISSAILFVVAVLSLLWFIFLFYAFFLTRGVHIPSESLLVNFIFMIIVLFLSIAAFYLSMKRLKALNK